MPDSPRTVLCVDDDADDRELVCYTINEIDPSFAVVHAENGIEAIEYLSKAKATDNLPCLVILDINMPKMDGKETLAKIKNDEHLNDLPVVIFSTSSNPVDKLYFADYGVDLITKPNNLSGMRNEIKVLLQYCGDV